MRQVELKDFYRFATLVAALKLELKGMVRSRSPSAYVMLKDMLQIKGTRQTVYTRACEERERLRLILDRQQAKQMELTLETRRAMSREEVQS